MFTRGELDSGELRKLIIALMHLEFEVDRTRIEEETDLILAV